VLTPLSNALRLQESSMAVATPRESIQSVLSEVADMPAVLAQLVQGYTEPYYGRLSLQLTTALSQIGAAINVTRERFPMGTEVEFTFHLPGNVSLRTGNSEPATCATIEVTRRLSGCSNSYLTMVVIPPTAQRVRLIVHQETQSKRGVLYNEALPNGAIVPQFESEDTTTFPVCLDTVFEL
jgi:hypothetical protein